MNEAAARWRMRALLTLTGLRKHMTLGVRSLCISEGKVLLVRHGYHPGLHLPGGGVDPGETAMAAAIRELYEETGARTTETPRLLGLYHNTHYTDRDHVAVYVFEGATREKAPRPTAEIVESGWFALDALPEDVSPATLRRLAELDGAEPSLHW